MKFPVIDLTNYSRGRAREYQTMHILREKGWVCTRSAMSHGPVDVIAAKSGEILLIQVKSGSARAKRQEISLIRKWAQAFNATAEVWSFANKGKIRKSRISSKTRTDQTTSSVAVPQILPVSTA